MKKKKKIVILSCKGGYCHESARLSIEAMGLDYVFETLFPIEEVSRIGPYVAANAYNTLVQNNWIRTMNFISHKLAPLWIQARSTQIEAWILQQLQEKQPDLVISVIPFINHPAGKAAEKMQIPYLLVTIDNDLTTWVLGLHRIAHPGFMVTIGRSHALTTGLLQREGLKESSIEEIGFPIHPSFLKKEDPHILKMRLEVPLDKPVIMIMMGGAGGTGALAYAQELQHMNLPIHVVVCTGNNVWLYDKMQEHVQTLERAVTFSVLRFTREIASWMQIADLLITKPGPGTIHEAMTRQLPILVDCTHSTLAWEKVNLQLIQEFGVGTLLTHVQHVRHLVPLYLYDDKKKNEIESVYRHLTLPVFATHIHRIIDCMTCQRVTS